MYRQETIQKQLGRINSEVEPYDKSNPNVGVEIPASLPTEEPLWAPRAQFPWITLSQIIFPWHPLFEMLQNLLSLFYYFSFFFFFWWFTHTCSTVLGYFHQNVSYTSEYLICWRIITYALTSIRKNIYDFFFASNT